MNREIPLARHLLLGLLELDEAGTVLYFNPELQGRLGGPMSDLVGRNFYTEVAPARNIDELREQLESFRRSQEPSRTIYFTFHFERDSHPVRLLLARVREQSEIGTRESIFVHLKNP